MKQVEYRPHNGVEPRLFHNGHHKVLNHKLLEGSQDGFELSRDGKEGNVIIRKLTKYFPWLPHPDLTHPAQQAWLSYQWQDE